MKNILFIPLIILTLFSCQKNTDTQPFTGSNWGEIPNPSAEEVVSSDVKHWTSDRGNQAALHFYRQD